MSAFKSKFSRIENGFSTSRRIPRLGKIRLGIKAVSAGGKEYPKETDYFVCPPEVQRIYGEKPDELDVMLMSEDPEIIFPQKLARYGSSRGLVCHGNGVEAERMNEQSKKWDACACPCEHKKSEENPKGDCTETAHLMVLLPKVNLGGCYQITTRSYNSAVDVNSGIEYIKALIGRTSMVPLKLKRQKIETHHDGKKQFHYTLSLTLDADIEGINKLREDTSRVLSTARFQLEGPVEENPASEPPDMIDVESVDEDPDVQPNGDMSVEPHVAQAQEAAPKTSGPQPVGPKPDASAALEFQIGKVMATSKIQGKHGEFHSLTILHEGSPVEVVTKEAPAHFGVANFGELVNVAVRFAWRLVNGRFKELYYLEIDRT